jgi:hypothetical protein
MVAEQLSSAYITVPPPRSFQCGRQQALRSCAWLTALPVFFRRACSGVFIALFSLAYYHIPQHGHPRRTRLDAHVSVHLNFPT